MEKNYHCNCNPDVKITGVPVSKTMNHVMTNVDALTARIRLMK